MCASISFLIVKINVSFSYFFFVFTRSLADIDSENLKTKDAGEKFTFLQIRNILLASFLAPLFLVLIFFDDLLGSSVTSLISIEQWHIVRIVFVLGAILLRSLIFRNEI